MEKLRFLWFITDRLVTIRGQIGTQVRTKKSSNRFLNGKVKDQLVSYQGGEDTKLNDFRHYSTVQEGLESNVASDRAFWICLHHDILLSKTTPRFLPKINHKIFVLLIWSSVGVLILLEKNTDSTFASLILNDNVQIKDFSVILSGMLPPTLCFNHTLLKPREQCCACR